MTVDVQGHISLIEFEKADQKQHEEVKVIRAFIDQLASENRTVEAASFDEMRAFGLSDDAIVLVVNGTPEQIRSVIGRHKAFIVKRGNPFGPNDTAGVWKG